MSNLKKDRGASSRSIAGRSAKKLPNNSSSKSSGQELNNSQEQRTLKQALIDLLPRNFNSLISGVLVVVCTIYALHTNNLAMLGAAGVANFLAPRAKQAVTWSKDHLQVQVREPQL